MPLSAACYVASVDKIFGVYGPYLMKFNATTGARESQAIVHGIGEATCGICYHAATSMLYVSLWNCMANQYDFTVRTDIDIYPVNPNSLAVGAGLGYETFYGDYPLGRFEWPTGPRSLYDFGTSFLYFISAHGSSTKKTKPELGPST